jgi:hypothetical protein
LLLEAGVDPGFLLLEFMVPCREQGW